MENKQDKKKEKMKSLLITEEQHTYLKNLASKNKLFIKEILDYFIDNCVDDIISKLTEAKPAKLSSKKFVEPKEESIFDL